MCKVSRRHFCSSKNTDTDWPFRFIAQGWDVRLAGMVSKAVVKMCRCFHTCSMTRFNNYASDSSLHVTLAVNKTLEISQVGRPSVSINRRNEFPIRRRDINHVIW